MILPYCHKKCSAQHFILEGDILRYHDKFQAKPILFAPTMEAIYI